MTVRPLEPGNYRYNFNVDGVAVDRPAQPATSESNDNTWSVVYVPGADFMDAKDVPHGAVAAVTYKSTSLERFRRMHVYTPPGYETGTQRYPVFYLLHGAMDCDDSWSTVGRAGVHPRQPDRGRQGEADDRRHARRPHQGATGSAIGAQRPRRTSSTTSRRTSSPTSSRTTAC